MAPASNGELVRDALLAQNRGDDDAFRAALHPDVEWHAGSSAFGFPEHMHGPDEVIAAARAARSRVGRLTATLHELREDGDDVLVLGALAGEDFTMPRAWIWTVQDGQVVRMRAYNSRRAALSAWDHRSHD
jgi:ketosteroid isomerase-like protein